MSDSLLLEDEHRIEERGEIARKCFMDKEPSVAIAARQYHKDISFLLSRLKAEREKSALRSAILRMGNAEQRAESAERERDEAVGQVAVLRGGIEAIALKWSAFDVGKSLEDLLDTDSAPLVAAHDAKVLEGAANLAACCHSGGEAAVAIRKLAADLKKGIADDLTKK